MLMFSPCAAVAPVDFAAEPSLRGLLPRVQPTSRSEHARMLAIAAARRLRAWERGQASRSEDADYWKAVAPAAISKAAGLRCNRAFARLPG
jgi:hypothetical protein